MTSADRPIDYALLAAELARTSDAPRTAEQIVDLAQEHFPDADEVSLTVRIRRRHETWASTGDMAEQADELQYELDEGPCVMATAGAGWVRSGDVRDDQRWRRWGPRAGELGVRSLMSVQLTDGLGPAGAINSYSRQAGAFNDPSYIERAGVFAIHATTALAAKTMESNLQTAMASRHDIGVAQGVLMERYGLTADRAFELLRRISADRHEKLRDVAKTIARTGELPEQRVG